MKVAVITDMHFGVRSDSREFVEFFEKCYGDFIVPYLLENDIKVVFDLGDTFDRRKFLNLMTLRSSKKMWFDKLRDNNIEYHSLVGNHTIYYRNTNEVNTMDLVLEAYPNAIVYKDPTEIHMDGCDILMMPWINSTNSQHCFDMIRNTKCPVMFGHLEIKGFEMHKGVPSHEGYEPNLFDRFDVVASGHFHKKSSRGNIHYLGAPYEMTWSDYNCPRGFHIFDTKTREFEYIRNPFRMFHKVIYDDSAKMEEPKFSHLKNTYVKVIVSNKQDPYKFEKWMEKLYDAKPLEVTIVDDNKNMDLVSDEDLAAEAEDTPTIISKYVSSLGKRVDPLQMNTLLQDLYREALDMEIADG